MTVMQFADRMPIAGTRRTKDGYLVADVRCARADNIQEYSGYELGLSDAARVFRIYRPDKEVFHEDAIKSFAHRPVTIDHPNGGVTADNWRQTAVGMTGEKVMRDGEHVVVSMSVMDAQAIADIESGKREISMGYDCTVLFEAGKTADGREYDAIQTGHRMNHLAIVSAGRAGPSCRIGDQLRTPKQQKDTPAMKTVTHDGKSYEVADDVAAVITKLQADAKGTLDTLKDGLAVFDDAKAMLADMKAKQEANDKALADAKAEAEAAKKAVPTADQVHAMAAELATVVDAAKRIAPDLDVKGKTADAIKLAAVTHVVGDDAVKGKSADYIAATFDHLMNTNDADPVAKALASNITGDASAKAYKAYDDHLANAWKQ